MDVEMVILDQIADLEKQIAHLRAGLQAVQQTKRKLGDPKMRFFDFRPLDAARAVLQQNGGRMKRVDLIESIADGGISHGKKRGVANIHTSLGLNIENGNLVQDGEYLELPKV
jgi:hypothetical protein